MQGILNQIVAHKREEVERDKKEFPLDILKGQLGSTVYPVRSMKGALRRSATGIIAEFKRKSPSRGWIFPEAEVETIVPHYEQAGASASSILTDHLFFGGSLDDLRLVRPHVAMPLLRKEFIIDPYQLYQARTAGADAVLLIAACLSPESCAELSELAHQIGLEVLLEIHTEEELAHLNPCVDMLGVNNRNLDTLAIDLNTSFRLATLMSNRSREMENAPLLISESGLADPDTVLRLRVCGFEGFLMGETFMKSGNPAAALSHFIDQLQ